MKRLKLIAMVMTLLAAALSVFSCSVREEEAESGAELMVSLYIPEQVLTRAETGDVSPISGETAVSTLQIWVFLSEDGTPVSYKHYNAGLDRTGLSGSAVTRFGMPLTDEMFARLSTAVGSPAARPKVDVYALANVASAISGSSLPGENTTRNELDALIVSGFGNSPLTVGVPGTGLPMSGVLRGADVNGGYPVLSISTLRLTRAVSKIRFVFCQQMTPPNDPVPGIPVNDECAIMGISFDGTAGGKDCQIGASEKLFTTTTLPGGGLFDLGTSPTYTPLTASISGTSGAPLIDNSHLSLVEEPENLFFRSPGYDTESAQQYEDRLDAVIDANSQIGPIYLRETDKTISGTITYRTSDSGPVQTAAFSLGGDDVFSRNHSWIVFACFAEETMSLQLKVVVMPWEWTAVPIDFTSGSVNVIRRFTVFDTTPPRFTKVQTTDGFYDVSFWHTVRIEDADVANVIDGDIIIATPVGAKLHIIPVPGDLEGDSPISNLFTVSPAYATIYPNYASPDNPDGRIEHCQIPIHISCNPGTHTDAELEGQFIDLHFCVEIGDGDRYIDLGSESIDFYRFILKKQWDQ
ncbi:MAG: hypothetical protein J6W74_02595 [Bacteroidales bacterium]|nr:hypothetical protein [Bacteroidales bacterium]